MQTVGQVLKSARLKKDLILQDISKETRIKEKFLEAIENSDWIKLPNYTTAQGFTQSFAKTVDADIDLVQALLRREFPRPQNPKNKSQEMPVHSHFVWTSKTTIFLATVFTFIVVTIYLTRQYLLFVAPPPLEVTTNKQVSTITVKGKTTPSALILINKKPALVQDDGTFTTELKKTEVGKTITIIARSRSGKETRVEKPVD